MNISKGKIHTAQKVVIYGPEGIGKSTFASRFPDPLFCDTEGSTKELDVRRFDRPSSFKMILTYIDYVKSNPDCCKTFVLDTADWAEKLIIEKVCAAHGKEGIEDFGYGNGYTYCTEEFGKLLNRLEDLIGIGINVVVTAHASIQKFEQPDENGSYNRWALKLINAQKCSDAAMLKEWADTVLFINYKTYVEKTKDNKFKASGGKRVMYTSHHPCWDAKNRWGLPDECDFDYSVISPHIFDKANQPTSQTPTSSYRDHAEVDNLLDNDPTIQKPAEISGPTEDLSGIPKALADLMKENKVTKEDIRLVVSREGYYPFEARIEDYDPNFVNGCLVGAWDQVLFKIMSNNDLPFGIE